MMVEREEAWLTVNMIRNEPAVVDKNVVQVKIYAKLMN